MKSIKNEFPNPVLADGRDDYIEGCSFHTTLDESQILVDANNIVIPITYELVCQGLQNLIEARDAVAVVSVKSSAASYSRLYKFAAGEKSIIITIPKYSVVKKIDITGSIVAAQSMNHFRCEGEFNDLYFGSATFEIRKGDVLATEDVRTIFIDDSELEKPITSVFTIVRNDDQGESIVPVFYDEKVEIRVKSEIFDLYYKFKDFNNGALRRFTSGLIVYPVLVEAIGIITGFYQGGGEDDGTDWSEKRWFRAIELKAESLGINLKSCEEQATTIANKLLGDICLDSLKSFKDTLDDEINSGESQMIGGVD